MISVFNGSDYLQAQLLTGLLQEHGITVFLQGAALQGGLGELPATGHLSIMVEQQDQAAARSLLAAYERGELAIDEGFAEVGEGE
jgi:Putative prokaryotic signal transducing protein